ncbi:efflux RND transporter periplasmic adaptor subunit [Aeoliella sp. ICT_H6.2]|uniref:Efflux RND transporter periplasmic adaptor subunit n=1 Tax=Aeoliella straminimaris TaxID=2954799 RepID=A0A9X2F909_9BACT|nr:efflux RND transporter periplasmic adaptor subunit [Aeoliella straminimaris]MCO6044597.1 efflux RND transporter periplasmic adaptor subunit [Aeoliella straminimaris]
MPQWTQHVARYIALSVITLLAIGIMAWVSMRDDSAARRAREQLTTPVPVAAQIKPLVAAQDVEASVCEVTSKFSGKIRAWETYSLGFEQPGRIVELGQNEAGQPLDDGSRVAKGQVLARLDNRVLQARVAEATANLEQASSDLGRARQVKSNGYGAITEAEYQQYLTQEALAKAALEIAAKNLQDAVLYAPVQGTIARRLAEPGEFVSANSTVFELVENDQLLLVIDVPESQIRELQSRMRAVKQAQQDGFTDPEAGVFRARVSLESLDQFGQPFPEIDAEVYRIAEIADTRTGLFEVEIRVPNENHLLRPGMVATAEVVTDRISAYSVPEASVLFRDEETYVFGLEEVQEPLQVMFWEVDEIPLATARKIHLTRWIDQGDHLLIPSTSVDMDRIIVRGHQRLNDGQHVRVTNSASTDDSQYVSPEKKNGKVAKADS